jgi:hypothetical protein
LVTRRDCQRPQNSWKTAEIEARERLDRTQATVRSNPAGSILDATMSVSTELEANEDRGAGVASTSRRHPDGDTAAVEN